MPRRIVRYCFLLIPFIVLLASGCGDKCKKITCENGECADGTCICTSGYEGATCADQVNTKYDGTYSATETCTAGDDGYSITLVPKAGTVNAFWLIGVWEADDSVTVTVNDNGLFFNIERQPLDNMEIDGDGNLEEISEDINLNYNVYFPNGGGLLDECTATLVRQ